MKLHFGHLVLFGALTIGGCAAFFSVFGISQLFAGAFWAVVIMASALEFGKLILASHLQRYWAKLGKIRRIYLSTLVIFLMIITSAGIYGLLSSAYQKTYTDYTIMENQVSFLEQKEGFYQSDIDRYDKDIAQINNNISTLSGAKVSSIQVRDTSSTTGVRNTISTAELRAAQARIATEETNKRALEAKRIVAIDSLNSYKTQILTLRNNTDISGELGPLIYLKELTGLPMDKVVNFFIILLVFVFDPMAIMLVLESNRIFEDKRKEKEEKESTPMSLRSRGHIDEDGKVYIDEVISMDEVKPLNTELDPNLKAHIDTMTEVQENLHENMTKAVGVPHKYFGYEDEGITDDDIQQASETLMEDLMNEPTEPINDLTQENIENGKALKEELIEALEVPKEKLEEKLEEKTTYPTETVAEPVNSLEEAHKIVEERGYIPELPNERPVAKNGIVKPVSNIGRTTSGPIQGPGIKREDIKEIKQGATRKFSKPIPRRRGNQ